MRKSLLKVTVMLGVAVSFLPTSAVIAEEGALIEEITVTARSRAESIQDIPIAITAFTEDDFTKQAINGLEDIARFTSGFSFEDFGGGFGTPVVRGTSQTQLTAIEQNVSTFYDGIYIPRSWAINTGVSMLERVEVVKGPQSARYGRNAFMGAVNLISLGPTEECEGSLELTVGSDERIDAKGTISGALVPGLINARASIASSEFDGSWDNTHPFANVDLGSRGSSGNAGGWDNSSFALAADITPNDNLTIGLSYTEFDISEETRGAGQFGENLGTSNCGPIGIFGTPRLLCGEIPGPGDSISVDPRAFGRQADVEITKVEVEYQISDLISLTYLYGNVQGEVDIATLSEPDPSNCVINPAAFDFGCTFQNTPVGGMDYDSHELRFAGDLGSINWAAGVYYNDGVDDTDFAIPALPPLTAAPTQGEIDNTQNLLQNLSTETEVVAIFGEVSFPFLDRYRASLELRYSEEDKTQINNANGASFSETFDNFTPRLSVEMDLSDNHLIYASIANGVKSGGFNPTAALVEEQSFDEEENWTFEIGSKSTFWNDRLQVNAAIFAIKWSDIQLNAADVQLDGGLNPSANIVRNLGDATTYGIEVDAIAQLTESFSVNGVISYVDATYDSGTIDNRFARTGPFFFPNVASCDDVLCPADGDVGGNQVERQAPFQLSVGAEYNSYIDALDSDFYIRADIAYQDEQEADSMNLAQIPDRTIVNASAGLSVGDVDLTVWARNLTDEAYTSNAFVVLIPFGNGYGNTFGERRTVGVTAKYSF